MQGDDLIPAPRPSSLNSGLRGPAAFPLAYADLIGQNKWQIMIKHLLPNCFPLLIVMFTGSVGGAVMAQSGLAYLGIGIKPPTPAWGSMVSEGYNYLLFKPHLALVPGIAMMLLIISLNIVGEWEVGRRSGGGGRAAGPG